MEQAHIIQKTTEAFAEKLSRLKKDNTNLDIIIDDGSTINDQGKDIIRIILLGVEEQHSQNMMEQIKKREIDDQGVEREYLIKKATLFKLKYVIVPQCATRSDNVRLLGLMVRLFKDDFFIEVGDYDWIDNGGKSIMVEPTFGMDLDKQMMIFNQLRITYTPSLFYECVVGIDSAEKQYFRRVEERKISTIKKKEFQ